MANPVTGWAAVLRRLLLPLAACAAMTAQAAAPVTDPVADPVDVQLAGQPVANKTASSLMAPLQNIYGRSHISLNGRWHYIIDPYENGYYDYRHMPFDQSQTGKGGYYDDRQPKDKTDWVEYDFDRAPTMKVPGDWNSQAEKLQLYEGTVWLR